MGDIIWWVFYGVIYGVMVALMAMRMPRSQFSRYELERRSRSGDVQARDALRQAELQPLIQTVRYVLVLWIVIIQVMILQEILGLLSGTLWGVIAVTVAGLLARIMDRIAAPVIRRTFGRWVGGLTRVAAPLWKILRHPSEDWTGVTVGSKQELLDIVAHSQGLLSAHERTLVAHSISFSDRTVNDVIILRDDIETVDKDELLGPLTLDGLYRTGFSRFPVVDGDIDHIMGILHIRSLLTLEVKKSLTAKKVMDTHVLYVSASQSLEQVLISMLRDRQHMAVVRGESGAISGIVTLEDIIELLIGRSIHAHHTPRELPR